MPARSRRRSEEENLVAHRAGVGGQIVLAEAEVRHAGCVTRSRSGETAATAAPAPAPGASSVDVELSLLR